MIKLKHYMKPGALQYLLQFCSSNSTFSLTLNCLTTSTNPRTMHDIVVLVLVIRQFGVTTNLVFYEYFINIIHNVLIVDNIFINNYTLHECTYHCITFSVTAHPDDGQARPKHVGGTN
jgi:hypothetical protein